MNRVSMYGQAASPAPTAANLPIVRGKCPECGFKTLFLGSGGYVTCSMLTCPDPTAASDVLEGINRRTTEEQQ